MAHLRQGGWMDDFANALCHRFIRWHRRWFLPTSNLIRARMSN
jgi:hypothetical protein